MKWNNYVGIIIPEGLTLVTEVDKTTKEAFWGKEGPALEMKAFEAKELAAGLIANGYPAAVIQVPFKLQNPKEERTMDNGDRLEFLGSIIDIFEDFLEEKGLSIPNEEKDEEPDENTAIIYGTDYGTLESQIEALLIAHGMLKEEK